jgi:hypothetical protein
MKKLIIASYFLGMFLLTYVAARAVSVYKNGNVEVTFKDHDRELSDTEMALYGITPRDNKKVVQTWKTKETRTKTAFGWETKIDTIQEPGTFYVDCNCH